MDNTGKTVAKNASFLMVSQLVTWSMAMLLMVFLPRYLGAEAVGQLHLANSIWAIAAIFISFGSGILITKELARSHDKFSELVGTSLVIRIIFYFVSLGVVLLYIQWANYSSQAIAVIIIIGVSILISQCSDLFYSTLVGYERMGYIAISAISGKLFVTVVALILLFTGQGVLLIASVYIGSTIIQSVIEVYSVHKIQPIKLNFRRDLVRWMLKAGAPFFLVAVFVTIYMQVDVVILSLLVNEEAVGWYGAADSLFGTMLFIPAIFLTAAFPALSRLHEEKSDALGTLMRKSFDILMLISVPIGLGLFVLGTEIVVLLFGPEFVNSGPVLSVMGIVLIFTYSNMLIGRFLISTNRQNKFTVVLAIAMFASVPLDLILIPWCQSKFGNGAIGGSLAFIVTEFGMLIWGIYLLPKGSLDKSNLWFAGRVSLAGLIMAILVWQFRDLFIAIPIAIGIITYGGMSWLLGVLPTEYIPLLQDSGKKLLMKFR